MCDYKDYFLFISEPRECKEVKDIRTNFSLRYGSKLTIHILGKVIFGILVHNENSTTREIREIIEKEGGWIIYPNNSRPFIVVKEVDQELFSLVLNQMYGLVIMQIQNIQKLLTSFSALWCVSTTKLSMRVRVPFRNPR